MTLTADAARPLEGVVVLDMVEGPLAPLCRLYADLGAEVVRIRHADSAGDAAPRAGLAQQIGDLGKRVLRLDPTQPADAQAFDALLRRAHMIVLSGEDPGFARGLDAAALQRLELVVMDVSMFGRDNSYSRWQATDAVLHALSGMLCRSGVRGREPLLPPAELAISCALAQAAFAGLVAVYRALVTGHGDRLDVSALDGAVQALDPGFGMNGTATMGRPAKLLSPERPAKGFRYPIFPCADGHVRICLLAPRQWQGMFRWLGEPAQFAGPQFNSMVVRHRAPELTAAIAALFANSSRSDLERQGQAFGVPIAALRTLDECLTADHLAERAAFVHMPLGDGRQAPVPNGIVEIDGVRMGPRAQPAPAAAERLEPSAALAAEALPLAGLKVLDLGVIVVGAEQGRLLADLGADVVKLECSDFPDGARQSYLPTGLSVSFGAGHRNKRSLGLNLRDPEGKAIFRRLAAQADVVLSNFKPGTLESLGISHEELAALNPAIISLESSAFGAHGPWASRMGYGPLVRAVAGVSEAWRYADDAESYSDSITVYPDHVAARIGATAVLALLIRRLRTGRGGAAKIAQLEVMLDHFATDIAARALGEPSLAASPDAPWGVYRAAGEDEWCVVTVRDDGDWRRLAPILGCDDAALQTREGRLAARSRVDELLSDWLSSRSSQDAMEQLQAAGVPAGRMLRVGDLPEFGYYRERRLFRTEQHPHMDEEVVAERFLARSGGLGEPPTQPAPVMGEHTAEVVRDWLGLGAAEIVRLIAAGVLEPTPPEIARLIETGEGRRETARG
ncbi:CoA transferase [Phenylobacterium sp. LjRoot225]|uniref:CaiB/BaiF CoA-transferase family protein n=1 Tax=Phenylobacterium sp. LjRoot225 TaxID=3342285 RepID=UPI003ED09365